MRKPSTIPAVLPHLRACALVLLCLLMSGCVRVPSGLEPVTGFELDRYLGRWYEIARLNHRFERDLVNVTAEYSLREDGNVAVVNRGYSTSKNTWKAVEGRALFVGERDVAEIKVSFFGPFFGGYNVIALDRDDYSYAMVCGPNRSFLWILAREPVLPAEVREALVAQARDLDFDVDSLIWVPHDAAPGGESTQDTGSTSEDPALAATLPTHQGLK